jgi:N4-gp56 family major capsid protein
MKINLFNRTERLSMHRNLAFIAGPLCGAMAIFARFAKTAFTTGNALTVKLWAADTFRYGYFNNFFNQFVGKTVKKVKGVVNETSPNALICKKTEFQKKKKGDKVTYALIDPLAGEGVIDDERLEDNEEPISSHDFSITLRRRRHATRSEGEMSDRRPAFDVQSKSRDVLGMWLARIHDRDVVSALSGVANAVGTIAASAPTTNRHWFGGQTSAGVVESVANDAAIDSATANLFGEHVIEYVKRMATLTEPVIRPIIYKGKPYFLMFIHGYQAKALKACTDWKAAQKDAQIRGAGNPLFTGALGEWDGVIIHEIPWIETRLGAGTSTASEYFESGDDCANGITVARALFCGAQAACVAYGGYPSWVEDKFDYENEWGIALSLFYQVAKPVFNSEDYGVLAVDTAIVPD